MWRSNSQRAFNLCSDILTEASTSAGTWALATHGRVRDEITDFDPGDVELFITQVIDRLIQSETPSAERFKLAQILTMCRGRRTAAVDLVLRHHRTSVTELIESLTNDRLAPATRRLLQSLYVEPKDGRRSPVVAVTRPAVDARTFLLPRGVATSRLHGK
jgi:hypothetical protein